MSSDLTPQKPAPSALRRRLGTALLVLGGLGIVWSALYMSDAAQGGRRRTEFSQRVGYDEAKANLHEAFAGGLWRGLGGLAVAALGMRLRRQ